MQCIFLITVKSIKETTAIAVISLEHGGTKITAFKVDTSVRPGSVTLEYNF
jgi:hypothetical protein